jgi:hypothetical protein
MWNLSSTGGLPDGNVGQETWGVTKRVYRLSIAPANRATRPKVPAIEATIR